MTTTPEEEVKAADQKLDQSNHDLAQPLQALLHGHKVMEATLDKIVRAVLGDKEYFQEGILPRMDDHEKRIRALENWRIALVGTLGLGAGGGVLAIIQHFLK